MTSGPPTAAENDESGTHDGAPLPEADPASIPPTEDPLAALAEPGGQPPSRLAERLAVWALFGMIFGLLPLIAVAIKGVMSPGGTSLDEILGGGEMFIVGAVTAAGAVGELFSALRTRRSTAGKQLAAGFCFLCSVCNSMAYLSVHADNPHTVAVASYISFGVTYLASGVCVAMAAGE